MAPRHVISGSISTWFDKFFNDSKSDRKKRTDIASSEKSISNADGGILLVEPYSNSTRRVSRELIWDVENNQDD